MAWCVLAAAFIVVAVRVLGAFHGLTGGGLLGTLLVASLAVAASSCRAKSPLPFRRLPHLGHLANRANAPLLIVAVGAIAVALLAADWLPVWQWDALGYHLPYVNFALVAHGFDGIPDDMPYVSTYPHTVETLGE